MSLTLRPVTREEIPNFRRVILRTFGQDIDDSDQDEDERYAALLPPERTCAAFDNDELVGTSGSFELTMSIPAGALAIAALTMVTVAPTHRRRGVLRRMIDAHLNAAEARGDAISALWASEAAIYGRFGYGVAIELDQLSLHTRGFDIDARFGADQLIALDNEAAKLRLPPIYEHVQTQRAGMLRRTETWWSHRHFLDPVGRRAGASSRRYVIAHRDGVDRGYLCYRQRPKFRDGSADGEVVIVEVIATDGQAEASLLRFATQIDLHPRVSWSNAPIDCTLPWIGSDFRRVVRNRGDAVWLRLCDVSRALAARHYAADGSLCIRVDDPLGRAAAGTYQLAVEAGSAHCQRHLGTPDLQLDLAALGSIYFGAVRPTTLARAGLIDAEPAALDRADAMFATRLAPWCPEIF